MANKFALLLVILTFITAIVWLFDKFRWAPQRRKKVEQLRAQTEGKIDGKILANYARSPKWIENTAGFFPFLLFILIFRSFIYEPYQIPSESMMPTLLVGDFILVEKFAYGLHNPITNALWVKTGEPKRGDVVVFKYPKDPSVDYIKRVVGLPGDKVVYNPTDKEVTIYPHCTSSEGCGAPLNLDYGPVVKSDFTQVLSINKLGNYQYNFYNLNDAQKVVALAQHQLMTREETLGKHRHAILLQPMSQNNSAQYYHQPGQPVDQWIVPPGEYFMMGDNRDDSEDSRYWGFVPEKDLIGKAVFIWFSLKKQPHEWPTAIRFKHLGKIE